MREDMWLVQASPEQGVTLRCFVKGTTDPEAACRAGMEKLRLRGHVPYTEAVRVHDAVTIRKEKR